MLFLKLIPPMYPQLLLCLCTKIWSQILKAKQCVVSMHDPCDVNTVSILQIHAFIHP